MGLGHDQFLIAQSKAAASKSGEYRMRVVFLLDSWMPAAPGGVDRRVQAIAKHLATRHQVVVLTSLNQASLVLDGVRFERICRPPSDRAHRSRSLWHAVIFATRVMTSKRLDESADFLLVESIPYLHLLPLMIRLRVRNSQFRVICDVHEAWTTYKGRGIKNSALSRAIIRACLGSFVKNCDWVLAISDTTARALMNAYKVTPSKLVVVPNGLDEELFELSEKLASADGAVVAKDFDFIFINRLENIKRPLDFIRAIHRLRSERKWNGRAALVGDGPLMDEVLRLRAKLSLNDCLSVFGYVGESLKFQLLSKSKVFVLCSEREGFSIATLEAMGFGLPVIAAKPESNDVSAATELVTDDVNGWLYPVGSVEKLAEKMWASVGEHVSLDSLSVASRLRAHQYNWESISLALEKLLGSTLKR